MRQAIEQQKRRNEVELAKLEERYADEEEQSLFLNKEYADFSTAPEFKSRVGLGHNQMPPETKGQLNTDRLEVNRDPVHGVGDRKTSTNTIEQLAEAIANLSHVPPVEVTKFTGDPKDYYRFITRSRDQVLSQPILESKKLSRVMQYLEGKAKNAVERYEGMGFGALAEALDVFQTRFGQP